MISIARILTFTLLVALLSGCGLTSQQIVKTKSFGTETASIGKLGEEEFVNIRNGIIEMNKLFVSIDFAQSSESFVFDKPTSAESTQKRIAACKALKLYGELLVILVTEDRSENLQKAATALIDNTAVALDKEPSEEQKGSINRIIVGLGSFWVDKKKQDSVNEIIPAYKQSVDNLADLLIKDFSLEDDSEGYLRGYIVTANRLKNASLRFVNAGNKYTVLERERAVYALVMAEEAITRATELSKKAVRAIESLKKANEELTKVIREQEYTTEDIKKYSRHIQELLNMYQVLAK